MSDSTLFERLPEEALVEDGGCRGLTVRLHRLESFNLQMVAVVRQDKTLNVIRREAEVGPRGVLTLVGEERFHCHPCFLDKLDRQLADCGLAEAESFVAENVLGGVLLTCRYRTVVRYHQVDLFCWEASPDPEVRRLGEFLQQVARSTTGALRRRAWLSRFW